MRPPPMEAWALRISTKSCATSFGAKTEVALEIQDPDGKLSLDKCAGVDAALAEACSRGLRWEVLSWKIEEEEDGILSVQMGLNDRAAAQMMEHEMQNIRQLARYCAAEANAAGEVKAGAVRARLIAVGASALAESPGFLHLFRFVIEQGGMTQMQFWHPCMSTRRGS